MPTPSSLSSRIVSRVLARLSGLLLMLPTLVFASHVDVARLATQLNLATGQLAYELRGSGAYSAIRQRSEYLSREAADLVDAVRRNRSSNHVQSRFRDVSRRFASLEQAFLRLHRKDYDPFLFNELDRISSLYTSLSQEFRYAGYGYEPLNAYSPPVIIYQQIPVPGYGVSRGFLNPAPSRYRNERDYGHEHPGNNRREYERRQVQRFPNYDHRSPVLDRQQRLDSRRPVVERGRRGDNSETSRRNHYE